MTSTKYRYYNANPFRKLTDDCYLRAISAGEGKTWKEVFNDLNKIALETGLVPGDEKAYSKYLIANGWVKQKQPVKANGQKYKIKEFLEASGYDGGAIVNAGACHLTYISEGCVWDVFNCEDRVVGCYWIVDDEKTHKKLDIALKKLNGR